MIKTIQKGAFEMTEKKTTILHGVLMYPIKVGNCALIFHRGQFIRTSTVVAIQYDSAEVVRFETLNTCYTLLLDPIPQTTANPTVLMPMAA